jgi:Fe-S oxidoreductase
MARMKIEFLHHWQRKHGLRIKDRLVAWLPRYALYASRMRWLLNLRDSVPGAAWLSERALGFSAKRSLPRWRGDPFTGDRDPHPAKLDVAKIDPVADSGAEPGAGPGKRELVLWADTFNNWFEPANLRAARMVLQAAGYRVHVARALADAEPSRPLCCGRTFLASGLIDEARVEARRTLAALAPFIERGVAVVGLEPSCLLSMRDEFFVMGLGEAAQRLAGQALLFEEFLAREHAAGRLSLPLGALPQTEALLHGHCHQKAFDAMRPIETVLGLVPGLSVRTIESSCCGMAGSFGYEHYDISMKMGEQSLLPAVRQAGAHALVVADGTSCRHQIADGAQREAIHVAVVLERALAAGRQELFDRATAS